MIRVDSIQDDASQGGYLSLYPLTLVPFSHETSITPLTNVYLLLLTPVYRSPAVTDPTAAELYGSPGKVLVIEETRDWDDLTRS